MDKKTKIWWPNSVWTACGFRPAIPGGPIVCIVEWGLEQRDLTGVTAIGVDEIAWRKGHNYLTLVYQIDTENIRLLWVGKARTVKTLLRFFRFFGEERSQLLKYICSDITSRY